ncbi:MAG: hypothetical protein WBM74_10190 [Polyangiales bacterium]
MMRRDLLSLKIVVGLFGALSLVACTQSQSTESLPAATGFFQVAEVDGRWWLVTPEGERFYSVGVNDVDPRGDTDKESGICPYCEAVDRIYDSPEAWAETTVQRLESWGFNTAGAWSEDDLLAPLMPYTKLLNYGGGQSDFFSDEFLERVARITDEQVVPRKDDPNLIGWFLDNELKWGKDWRVPATTMLEDYLLLEEGSAGRQMAEQYRGDPEGFLLTLADQYFRVTSEALREADPNHLILGARASSLTMPPQVPQAAAPYIDVFSVNFYATIGDLFDVLNENWGPLVPIDDWLQAYHELSGLPLMATEFSYRSSESDPPNTFPPIYFTFPTQRERAAAYDGYVQNCFDAPYIVGQHWFEYVDQPLGGRGDGEDNNFGLITVNDEPYEDFLGPVTVTNSRAPHLAK